MSNKNRIAKNNQPKKPAGNKQKAALIAAIAIIAVIAVVVIAVFAIDAFTKSSSNVTSYVNGVKEGSDTEESSNEESSDKEVTDVGNYIADINIADYGTITVELDSSAAPITVQNFVDLANSGFYDGLTFHRIMEGFMMQGGDPLGNGMGGSDNTIKGEFSTNGVDNPISHTRGVISMARSGDPDSASSQFFIVHQDALFLDGSYAGFGKVIDGMDVVDAVCEAANPTDDNGSIAPEEQPVINSITIR